MAEQAAKAKRPSLKKYKRERKEKTEPPAGTILVGMGGPPSQYISQAIDAFDSGKSLTLMGRGAAMGKTVRVAEIVRRRVKGLHMSKEVTTDTVTDKYVGRKEDDKLEPVTVESTVKSMKLVLSLDALDEKSPGYKAPIDESKVVAEDKEKRSERGKKTPGGRGRGKGGKKGRGRGAGKKDEFGWLPVRRGAGGGRGGGVGRGKGLPARGGGRQLPSRGGGRKGGLPSRGGGRQGGGGQYISGVPRSRGAGSRPYSGASRGGGGRPAPVRSRGGGGGGARAPLRSRGGGGYSGPPRSRGAGAAPPRSRGGRRY